MRIGELAQRTGASTRALRHYESARLLTSHRLPNGYRDFDDDQVERVRVIRALLTAGLNLDAITSIAPCYTAEGIPGRCAGATERLRVERDRVDRRAAELVAVRERLDRLLDGR